MNSWFRSPWIKEGSRIASWVMGSSPLSANENNNTSPCEATWNLQLILLDWMHVHACRKVLEVIKSASTAPHWHANNCFSFIQRTRKQLLNEAQGLILLDTVIQPAYPFSMKSPEGTFDQISLPTGSLMPLKSVSSGRASPMILKLSVVIIAQLAWQTAFTELHRAPQAHVSRRQNCTALTFIVEIFVMCVQRIVAEVESFARDDPPCWKRGKIRWRWNCAPWRDLCDSARDSLSKCGT